jgi:REase_AHJR-like
MDFEHELRRLAERYTSQGFQVVVRPDQDRLPAFAKDFTIEILGRRGDEGILVAVKKDRGEVAADQNLTRYAEITNLEKGWRFDLAVVGAEQPNPREIDWATDFAEADIEKSFSEALDLIERGFIRPAVIT